MVRFTALEMEAFLAPPRLLTEGVSVREPGNVRGALSIPLLLTTIPSIVWETPSLGRRPWSTEVEAIIVVPAGITRHIHGLRRATAHHRIPVRHHRAAEADLAEDRAVAVVGAVVSGSGCQNSRRSLSRA